MDFQILVGLLFSLSRVMKHLKISDFIPPVELFISTDGDLFPLLKNVNSNYVF